MSATITKLNVGHDTDPWLSARLLDLVVAPNVVAAMLFVTILARYSSIVAIFACLVATFYHIMSREDCNRFFDEPWTNRCQ